MTKIPKFPPPFLLKLAILISATLIPQTSSLCRSFCNNVPINFPFAVDDGCGAVQFRRMLNCSGADLLFVAPSGTYKIQNIDYTNKHIVIFDPAMSTCSILQPHRDFKLTEVQHAVISPSADTIFALMNCSIDSPVLNRYRSLCFNFSGHSCDELYGACTSFKLFRLLSNSTPACCFTSYDTVRYMSMNILDCSHYTSVYDVDGLSGVGPLDWKYGIKLSYSVPDFGCDRCVKSGGRCGFDVETEGFQCICSNMNNATRECAAGSVLNAGKSYNEPSLLGAFVFFLGAIFHR